MLRASKLLLGYTPVVCQFRKICRTSTALKNIPELTADRYSHVKRGEYALLTESDVSYFKSLLSDGAVITDMEELDGFNTDWMGIVRGKAHITLVSVLRNTF